MKEALIIFVRHPEKGKVKTRLAATLGDDAALVIYKKLLHHTLEITQVIKADKFVFYAGPVIETDMWSRVNYFKMQQAEGDLGHRMCAAFKTVFARGYSKVCIVGSDCFELSSHVLSEAFSLLNETDVVVGPAHDGGYYLLAMKQLYSSLFQNKTWSTNSVLKETLKAVSQLNLSLTPLPLLHDVDEVEDVPQEWLAAIQR